MRYSFSYQCIRELPKLTWLAQVDRSTGKVTAYCGSKVEQHPDFLVAGVWDAPFVEAGFDVSDVFYGTGAKLKDNGVMFVTPSHSMERLLLYENKERITVSNSFPFLLEFIHAGLDRTVYDYENILCSMLNGPGGIKDIPVSGGEVIRQFVVSNITVTDHEIIVTRRPSMEPFADYNDYYARITGSLCAVKANLSAAERSSHFGMVATISSGYDSTACAALARTIGCDCVVTLKGGQYDSDNGLTAAKALGYRHIESRDKLLYKRSTDSIEAMYLCNGELGTELQFSVFDDLTAGCLVFLGSRGSYWNKSYEVTEDFEMKGYYFFETGVSYTEDALKNGSIYIPLPAFGASVCNSIKRISNSDEMKPWSVGGDYDRPIPRRIAETAGVPREAFGMKKYGGGFSFCYDNMRRIRGKMSESGYASFLGFRKSGKGVKKGLKRLRYLRKYDRDTYPIYLNAAFGRLRIPIRLKQKPNACVNPGAPADLIFWGVDVMKKRYAEAMNQV